MHNISFQFQFCHLRQRQLLCVLCDVGGKHLPYKKWSINKHGSLWSLSWGIAAERRANKDSSRVEGDWDNRDINPHIPEGRSLGQDVHLAAWLGCGSAHPAGLHIADRCSASQACSATGSVCSRKTRRPDAATWCPTRLLLRYTGHAPVAITWPQTGFWDCVPSITSMMEWSGAGTERRRRVDSAGSPLCVWQAEFICQIVLNNESNKVAIRKWEILQCMWVRGFAFSNWATV